MIGDITVAHRSATHDFPISEERSELRRLFNRRLRDNCGPCWICRGSLVVLEQHGYETIVIVSDGPF